MHGYTDSVPNSNTHNIQENINVDTGRPHMIRTSPAWLKDHDCSGLELVNKIDSKGNKKILYPIQHSINYANISQSYKRFIASTNEVSEPDTFEEAVKDERWIKATHDEISTLERNKTWIITDLPPGKKAIGCNHKWVFKKKFNADGTLNKLKARLVEKGFSQIEGIDYSKTFSPVVKMNTVRAILALATKYNWNMFQMDADNAFL